MAQGSSEASILSICIVIVIVRQISNTTYSIYIVHYSTIINYNMLQYTTTTANLYNLNLFSVCCSSRWITTDYSLPSSPRLALHSLLLHSFNLPSSPRPTFTPSSFIQSLCHSFIHSLTQKERNINSRMRRVEVLLYTWGIYHSSLAKKTHTPVSVKCIKRGRY